MKVKSSTAYWRFEVATGTLIPSDHCRALHGLPPDAPFSFAHYLAAIYPDDRQAHREALDRAINETGSFDARYRIVWPDGSVHHVRALGSLSPEGTGEPRQLIGASMELID